MKTRDRQPIKIGRIYYVLFHNLNGIPLVRKCKCKKIKAGEGNLLPASVDFQTISKPKQTIGLWAEDLNQIVFKDKNKICNLAFEELEFLKECFDEMYQKYHKLIMEIQ
jgi:hypothetical protein